MMRNGFVSIVATAGAYGSWIPLAVHRKDGAVNRNYRSKTTPRRIKKNGYGDRWIVESFMSGLKRTSG